MTAEELRALDVEIADKVFGLCVIGDGEPYTEGEMGETYGILRYSTDMSAAWGIIHHICNEEGGSVRIWSIAVGDATPQRWGCAFCLCLGPFQEVEVEAETLPLAICQAALKALKGTMLAKKR